MSTKKPTSGGKNNPKQNRNALPPGVTKKRKPTGFIETTGYKPNWLETGPLDPEMLPDPLLEDDSPLSADEFEALQQALQGFYQQEALDHPEDAPVPPVVAEVAAPVAEPVVEPAEPPAEGALPEDPAPEDQPAPDQPPAPEAWIQPLLADDALSAGVARPLTVAPPVPVVDDVFEDETDIIEEEAVAEPPLAIEPAVAAAVVEPPAPAKPRRQQAERSGPRRRRDRLGLGLLFISLLLLGAAALVYYVNPFSRLALGAASLARPVASSDSASPATGSGNWCVQGEFQAASAAPVALVDGGAGGDLLGEDGIFSVEQVIPRPGAYEWQVIDCDNPELIFPPAPAWITTTAADQPVTFTFDSNESADPLFFPIPFVVSALDAAEDYRLVGDFQGWNPDDASGRLEQINIGLYQQVRRIARAGSYEGYVIAGNRRQAIDAYGRTTEPIPFAFETERNGDYVVFLVDTDRGRASVIYDMPPLLASLSYGRGHLILSLTLAGLSLLLLLGLMARYLVLHNRRLQLDSGCPRCGRSELMRIARRSSDRFLHIFGIPAYRYRCRHCTWEGSRLSESGETVSPGISTSRFSGD